MTGPQDEVLVARRIVMRRGLWEEITRVSEETGLEIEEVVRLAIEAGVKKTEGSKLLKRARKR